jgi:predicted PurR-regulated permease PerM
MNALPPPIARRTIAKSRPPRGERTFAIAGRTFGLAAAIVGGVWLLGRIWPILMALVVGLVLFGTFHPLIRSLENKGWSRGWATAALVLLSLVVTGGLALVIVPSLWQQVMSLFQDLPKLQAHAAHLAARFPITKGFAPQISQLKLDSLATGSVAQVFDLSSRMLAGLGYALTAVVLAIYFLIEPKHIETIAFLMTPRQHHVRLARVLQQTEVIVGGYVRGQLITSAAMFIFSLGLLAALRVPNPLALAAFAAITDVLPFVGGLLATTPAALAAITRGPWVVLAVVVAMGVYQEVESRLIVPRVYGRVLRLSPPAVILALLIGGELMGILGALLALPVAASIRMLITELRVELPGDAQQAAELRAKEAVVERVFERRTAGEPVEAAAEVAHRLAEQTVPKEAKTS